MAMAGVQTGRGMPRVSAAALSAGIVVSITLHLSGAVGAARYLSGVGRLVDERSPADVDEEAIASPPLAEEMVALGRRESSTASINWLGVVESPERGVGIESEIEQAQFTREIGEGAVTIPSEAQARPSESEQQRPEPAGERSPAVVGEMPAALEPVAAEHVELAQDEAAVAIEQPPVIEQPQTQSPEPRPAAEEMDHTKPVGPELASGEPDEPVPPQPATERSSEPTVAGTRGILDERESAATMLREAVPVEQEQLNRPLAAKGMEIITVEPRFPATTRFTQLPRNPVVLIRFDARGRVIRARFLRDEKRVYDTGSRSVDEPLINAIYQWRAKGEPIEKLTHEDPGSFVEISMRILFRK